MIAGRFQIVEQFLDARFVRHRRIRVWVVAPGLSWIRSPQAMRVIHLFGLCIVGRYLFVGDRPRRRDSIVMPQLAEVLFAKPVQRSAIHLGGSAYTVVHLRLERFSVAVIPGFLRNIAVLHKHRCSIPILGLAFEPVAAFQNEDILPGRCQLPGQRAATRSAADDDDVVILCHRSAPLQPRAALHNAAIGKYRCGGDIARATSRKEGNYTSDLLRLRHSSQRYGSV